MPFFPMRLRSTLLLLAFSVAPALAGEVKISTVDPLVVSTPSGWAVGTPEGPRPGFPFPTTRIVAMGNRNAVCMISVLDRGRPEIADADLLKRILRGDSRPYLASPADAAQLEIKELALTGGGHAYYANFTDPDLVGKPVKKGSYKTATPMIIGIGQDYLLKVTILCDDFASPDYQEALKIVKSLRVPQPAV